MIGSTIGRVPLYAGCGTSGTSEVSVETWDTSKMRRYVPWLLLGLLTVAAALGLGLGLAETPASSSAACQSDELGTRVTTPESVASQPWLTIAFTNNGGPCSIEGYPRIVAASGHTYQGSIESLPIKVIEGPLYERTDPGSHLIGVAEGSHFSFALGTGTASGTIYVITAISVMLPGNPSPLRVPVDTSGSASTGSPIELRVTALGRGANGPPSG